jgi:predicted SAM-dependent methyltransferase
MLKLHLGCGDIILPDYVNIDLYNPKADLECDIHKLPYDDNSVDEIVSCHVIEHFGFKEAFDVLREWYRVLKPEGYIITETPDFLESCRAFVNGSESERINLYGHFFAKADNIPGQVHRFLYTENQLKWTLANVGFRNITRVPALRYIGMEHLCLKLVAQK